MPGSFEWQKSDEATGDRAAGDQDGWDLAASDQVRSAGAGRRSWKSAALLAAVILAAAAVTGFVVFRYLEKRSAEVEADVAAAHSLFIKAAQERDRALLEVVLPAEASEWQQSQQQLLEQGLLLGRESLGLQWAGDEHSAAGPGISPAPDGSVDVTLSPDLMTAVVTTDLPYALTGSDQTTHAVMLQQTSLYRRNGQGWLLAPPEPGFWGETVTVRGERLTLDTPGRDEAIARRLVPDLEAMLDHLCQTLADLRCPADLQLAVSLDGDLTSLAAAGDYAAILGGGGPLRLPAPTLAGRPTDEASYQALLRGYAAPIAAVAIAKSSGWSCCQKGLFFRALLDKQLSQLDLRPWPLTPAEVRILFREPLLNGQRLEQEWRRSLVNVTAVSSWRQVYSMVDYFLAAMPEVSAAAWQRYLVAAGSFYTWLERSGMDLTEPLLARHWLRFAGQQLASGEKIPLPDQDILLLCGADVYNWHGSVYRYDLESGAFSQELTGDEYQLMDSLPGDDGLLLQGNSLTTGRLSVYLWHSGIETAVSGLPEDSTYFLLKPSNPEILLLQPGSDTAPASRLALSDCDGGPCQIQPLSGNPVWSPGGEHSLLVDSDGLLWLGDERGEPQSPIGPGQAPFWLDDRHYGYVDTQADTLLAGIPLLGGQPALSVPLAEVAAAIPAAEPFSIHSLAVWPGAPQVLLVAANINQPGPGGDQAWIASYDLSSGLAALLLHLESKLTRFQEPRLSAGGRWLAIQNLDWSRSTWQLHLVDLDSGQSELIQATYFSQFPVFDWSADGRWLLRIDGGFLHLLAPGSQAERLVVYDYLACPFAAWTDKLAGD